MYNVRLSPKGIIEVTYEGALTVEEYEKADKDVSQLLDLLPNREGLVLIDVSKLTIHTSEVRRAAVEASKNMENCRVAFFTPNIFNRAIATLLVSSANRSDKDKVFKNKPEANDWLESIREEFEE